MKVNSDLWTFLGVALGQVAGEAVSSILSGSKGASWSPGPNDTISLSGGRVMSIASVQIRKIKNGFIVQYEEGVKVPDRSTELERQIRQQVASMGANPTGHVVPVPSVADSSVETDYRYEFHSVEVFVKDAEELAKVMSEALQAVVLRESENERMFGDSTASTPGGLAEYLTASSLVAVPSVSRVAGTTSFPDNSGSVQA